MKKKEIKEILTVMTSRLIEERRVLKEYISAKLKVDVDYHAISDAANDIRELDVKIETYRKVIHLLYAD